MRLLVLQRSGRHLKKVIFRGPMHTWIITILSGATGKRMTRVFVKGFPTLRLPVEEDTKLIPPDGFMPFT
jgi:hypothetical protein